MSKNKIPMIRWGAGNANTLNIGYPLDNWAAGSVDREGSEYYKTMGGVVDSWIVGLDYNLSGDIRWIPSANSSNPTQTGWDGSTGVRAFLEFARAQNTFMFYPDKDGVTAISSSLVEPLDGSHSLEPDGTRSIRIRIRNTTVPYDNY